MTGWNRTIPARTRRRLKLRLSEAQNHRCCLCGWRLDETPLPDLPTSDWASTFEHIIPRHDGGRDTYSNLAISHKICNWQRRD